ncbi:MAG TPA: FAD-dependent monooxygenase [Pirellulales bacterium]|nr:FAD-dependent monooxygenase [Pirellulales bacterium]
MQTFHRPLIVGGGPVGLAAGVFLARDGIATRIVEKNHAASVQSKALAINPRTLEILDAVGLTERLLAIGKIVNGACLWHGERLAATIDFTGRLKGKYPFMLALSQATPECLLEETLVDFGGTVERGSQLIDCKDEADGVSATLDTKNGQERYHAEWMLAADGAHSTTRESLNIEFPGSTFREKWDLADVPLATSLAEDRAHAIFLPNREFQFMIRVIDPHMEQMASGPLWRVMGNRPGLLERLAHGKVLGPAVWSSSFGVSHRINRTMSAGHVYFAGDAAHLHSPVGARGMNLGIEDAWFFAQLLHRRQLSRYHELRHAIDRQVVRRVDAFSRLVACEPPIVGLFRPLLAPLVRLGLPTARMTEIITGTDHPLGEFAPVSSEAAVPPLSHV